MTVPVHINCTPACIVCGMGVDRERYEKRPYCLDPDCIKQEAKPLLLLGVAVAKSIPQILLPEDVTPALAGAGRRRA